MSQNLRFQDQEVTELLRICWRASGEPGRVFLGGREIIAGSPEAMALQSALVWAVACSKAERDLAGSTA